MSEESPRKACGQCKRTDVEELELTEGDYYFKGLCCPKHAAEWRKHFEEIARQEKLFNEGGGMG